MSQNQKPNERRDLFSELMFGKPPEPEPPEKKSFSLSSLSNIQLDQMIQFMQNVGPTLDKLAPLIVIAQTFFNQNDQKKMGDHEKEEKSD